MPGQDHGQWSREKTIDQRRGAAGDMPGYEFDHRRIGHMHDERIVGWPSLRAENLPYRRGVQGVGAETIHRLRRKCRNPAGADDRRGDAR